MALLMSAFHPLAAMFPCTLDHTLLTIHILRRTCSNTSLKFPCQGFPSNFSAINRRVSFPKQARFVTEPGLLLRLCCAPWRDSNARLTTCNAGQGGTFVAHRELQHTGARLPCLNNRKLTASRYKPGLRGQAIDSRARRSRGAQGTTGQFSTGNRRDLSKTWRETHCQLS